MNREKFQVGLALARTILLLAVFASVSIGDGFAQSIETFDVPNGALLRAERLGSGTGQTYTLNATATDLAGNTTTATAECVVPRQNQRQRNQQQQNQQQWNH